MAPASAKGDGLVPARDRYEPGETATLIGYSGGPAPTSRFSAGIAKQPAGPVLEIGRLVIQPTGNGDASLALRVSITFAVPRDLPPGEYQVGFTDEKRTTFRVNDILWGVVWVGMEPPGPIARRWALDEPEIANLAPDAVIYGAGTATTARQVWEDRLPASPAELLPAPSSGSVMAPATETGERAAPSPVSKPAATGPTLLVAAAAVAAAVTLAILRRSTTRRRARPTTRPSG